MKEFTLQGRPGGRIFNLELKTPAQQIISTSVIQQLDRVVLQNNHSDCVFPRADLQRIEKNLDAPDGTSLEFEIIFRTFHARDRLPHVVADIHAVATGIRPGTDRFHADDQFRRLQ